MAPILAGYGMVVLIDPITPMAPASVNDTQERRRDQEKAIGREQVNSGCTLGTDKPIGRCPWATHRARFAHGIRKLAELCNGINKMHIERNV